MNLMIKMNRISNKRICLLMANLLIVFALHAQSLVTGFVFEDSNGNNTKEYRENGISNVAVSNGHDVVLTDKQGKYKLPVDNDNIIFVIKPSGYKVNVDENNLPQFYYIHKPQGSPRLKYKGVSPTGNLPEYIDFALTPNVEDEKFTILVFGDPQISNLEEVDFFTRGIMNEVTGIKNTAFGLSLGDMAFDNLNMFEPYKKAVSRAGIPWYNVLGNHDMNKDVTADSLSDESFEANFGPANYSFNYSNVHFVIIDNIIFPNSKGEDKKDDYLREDQLKFIENDLKFVPKNKLVVFAMHAPLQRRNEQVETAYKQRIFDLLSDFPYTLSLSAHTHIQYQEFFTKADGWKQEKPHHHYNVGTTCGNWYSGELDAKGIPVSTMADGTLKGYAYINFTDTQYTIDYKAAGKPQDYQMEIWMPKIIEKKEKVAGWLYANFFIGYESDKVEYRIDGGKWGKMELKNDYDPSYLNSMLKWDTTKTLLSGKRRPGRPAQSDHLWWIRLDSSLPAGEHTVEVKATDMFRREFTQKGKYTIAERN